MSVLSSPLPALGHPGGADISHEDSIAITEWKAISELIDEVFRDQNRTTFDRSLVEWQLAARQFRKVETRRIVLREPDATDLQFHAICLHSLLAMGETLKLWSRSFADGKLGEAQITRADLDATVESLKQSLREWHHGFTAEEVERTREAIFGGAT